MTAEIKKVEILVNMIVLVNAREQHGGCAKFSIYFAV
jgi:hypothetical protein